MSLRISNALALACLVAACSEASPEPEGEAIECAIGAGVEFSPACTLEEVSATEFVIHSPDGGFRRFEISDDGALQTRDGADEVLDLGGESPSIAEIEVSGDRYRIPRASFPTPQ